MLAHGVLQRERESQPGLRPVEHLADAVDNELASDPHIEGVAGLLALTDVYPATVGMRIVDAAVACQRLPHAVPRESMMFVQDQRR